MKRTISILALALTAFGMVTVEAPHASAIIGRPLTPVSYAGVARRSVRRGAVYGAGYGAGVATTAAVVGTAAAVNSMPAGCAVGAPCGGAVYQPAYSGPNVVYVPQ